MQRFTFKGEQPKAAFTAENKEALAHFNASSSTAPGGAASYEWQLNTAVGSLPIESSLPTLTYSFPAFGTYKVALTVFAADGTSNGTAQVVNLLGAEEEKEKQKEKEEKEKEERKRTGRKRPGADR